jgi:hypothetical protein
MSASISAKGALTASIPLAGVPAPFPAAAISRPRETAMERKACWSIQPAASRAVSSPKL